MNGRLTADRKRTRGALLQSLLAVPVFLLIGAWLQAGAALDSAREVDARVEVAHRAASRAEAPLEVLSLRAVARAGHIVIDGEARNCSPRTIENLEMVVELRSASGSLIASEAFLAAFPRLASGQNTPFRAILEERADATRSQIRFRSQFGDELPVFHNPGRR